ncbi:ABC transporter permease [Lachnospiraceae bacterium 38-10]
MMALWKAEYQKTRGRHLMLLVFAMSAAGLLWALSGKLSEDAIAKGWYMLLYQMPLINELILPMTAMLIASRLGDLEHKNGMMKQLCCVAERGKLYDVKLLYGLTLVLAGVLIQWFGIIADGLFRHHFEGPFLLREYLLLLLFTMAPTSAVYTLLHAAAMCCVRPAVPYIVGIIGEFVGLLSMFLPYTWLIKGTPWGYYGALMLLRLEYDRATRISTYFCREIDWVGFAEIVIITIVIYIIGRIVFCRIES